MSEVSTKLILLLLLLLLMLLTQSDFIDFLLHVVNRQNYTFLLLF